jgi:adenosine kinase
VIQAASIFYVTGFFLTVSCEAIDLLGKHCVAARKTLCMNLSAPFLVQFFNDQVRRLAGEGRVWGVAIKGEGRGVAINGEGGRGVAINGG